jgi:hypothetical protein
VRTLGLPTRMATETPHSNSRSSEKTPESNECHSLNDSRQQDAPMSS